MHSFPQETVPKGGKCLFQRIYLQTLLSFAAEVDHCESLDNSILHPEQKENSILKVFLFSKVTTRKCKSISFSMEVFSSIAVFCILGFDNHLASIKSKKISNASMITESKNPIILSHLGTLSNKKNDIIWEFFPTWGGGVFPNPKTFVNLPSIFLYAKLGPKWPQMVKNMLY